MFLFACCTAGVGRSFVGDAEPDPPREVLIDAAAGDDGTRGRDGIEVERVTHIAQAAFGAWRASVAVGASYPVRAAKAVDDGVTVTSNEGVTLFACLGGGTAY